MAKQGKKTKPLASNLIELYHAMVGASREGRLVAANDFFLLVCAPHKEVAIPNLIALLYQDPSPSVRRVGYAVISEFATWLNQSFLKLLKQYLAEADVSLRSEIGETLLLLGRCELVDQPEALAILAQGVQHLDADVRLHSLMLLVNFGSDVSSLISVVIGAIHPDEELVSQWALFVISSAGFLATKYAPAVCDLIHSELYSSSVKSTAAKVLGILGNRGRVVTATLFYALTLENNELRFYSAVSLLRLGSQINKAKAVLSALIQDGVLLEDQARQAYALLDAGPYGLLQ